MLISFWPDSFVPTGYTMAGTFLQVGIIFSSTSAGTVNSIQFWKDAADTGSHLGNLWRESDQALLGQVTFSGETASGWQTQNFSSPIPIAAGTNYRATVNHNGGQYPVVTGGYGTTYVNPMTRSATAATTLSGGFPAGTSPNSFLTDIIADVIPTSIYASQDLAEAWVADTPQLRASQTLAEVWVQNQPPTDLRASQELAEVWVTNTGVPTQLRASQVLAETWLAMTGPPPPRRFFLSSQVA